MLASLGVTNALLPHFAQVSMLGEVIREPAVGDIPPRLRLTLSMDTDSVNPLNVKPDALNVHAGGDTNAAARIGSMKKAHYEGGLK